MRDAARLIDIRALDEARAAFVTFRDETNKALLEVDLEVQRAVNWVRNEMAAYWKQQERKRHEALEMAKSELRRAQFPTTDGRIPEAVEQKKAVAKAEAAMEEARTKIENVRKWTRLIEREVSEYRGVSQPLAGTLDAELPRAIALLDRMTSSVERYLAVTPSESDEDERAREADGDSSMARPADIAAPNRYALPLIRADRAALRERLEALGRSAPDDVRLLPPVNEDAPRLPNDDAATMNELALGRAPVDPNDRIIIEPGALDDESPAFLRLAPRDEPDGAGPSPAWVIGSTLKKPAEGEALVVPLFRLLQSRRDLRPIVDLPPGTLVILDKRGVAAVYAPTDEPLWNQAKRSE